MPVRRSARKKPTDTCAAPRTYLREVFNGLRWVVRTGSPWRYMPHDLPPWQAVYQQTQWWIAAGVFEAMVHDLRALLRLARGRAPEPTAAVLDSRTLRSTPESGHRGSPPGGLVGSSCVATVSGEHAIRPVPSSAGFYAP
jgi:transposase